MYSLPEITLRYLKYYFSASNGKGHGIHSPFVYDFITKVLNDTRSYYAYDAIENLRDQLKKDHSLLEIEDMGAGSNTGNHRQRSVSSVVRNAAKSKKLARLLFRTANYFQSECMLELGTSLGITSAYLAMARPRSSLVTIEGAPAIANAATRNFQHLGIRNIAQLTGNFDAVLPQILPPAQPFDFVYIDGNHRYEPTMRYFNQILPHLAASAVMVFDDVHWSPEMEQAWQEIKQDPRVMLTVDVFFLGFVFFRPEFKVKQAFDLKF